MRLGSLMDGLAAARQGQAEDRPKLILASAHSVSPFWTRIVGAALFPSWRAGFEVAATAEGRGSCAPAPIWLGLTMLGLAASSAGQRLPWPRFSSASFQRESPLSTLTVFCVAVVAGRTAGCAFNGRTVEAGAAGSAKIFDCLSVDGTGGCSGWMRILGVTGREEI